MRERRIALLLVVTVAWAGAVVARPAAEPEAEAKERVVLCFDDLDVAPWRTRRGKGLNFTMLEAVAQRSGIRFTLQPEPWRRCQDNVRRGRVDGSFGMSWTPERAAFALYPGGATPDPHYRMFEGGYLLVRRRGTTVAYDGQRITGLEGNLGAEPATSIAQDLRRRGYRVEDNAPDTVALLRKLASGRLGAAAIGTDQWHNLQREQPERFSSLEALPVPLVNKPYFVVFSKPFAERRPELAQRIWENVAAVRASPEYRAAMVANGRQPPEEQP